MNGYKIKFNGIDRLYDAYSWRLTRRAKQAWQTGSVLQGKFLKDFEVKIAEQSSRKFAVGVWPLRRSGSRRRGGRGGHACPRPSAR